MKGSTDINLDDKLKCLAEKSRHAEHREAGKEAVKQSVIEPLICALGFDITDFDEVTREFTADVGRKKEEKVDYAINIKSKVAILIEVEPVQSDLGNDHCDRLRRPFDNTEARIAILTNGRELWFFSDIDTSDRMDRDPFFVFNLQNQNREQVEELTKYHKNRLDIDLILKNIALKNAAMLKFRHDTTAFIEKQIDQIDDTFVRYIVEHVPMPKHLHDGETVTEAVTGQIRPVIQSALDQIVQDRAKGAKKDRTVSHSEITAKTAADDGNRGNRIVTSTFPRTRTDPPLPRIAFPFI
ncbi:MAG: type I restriction enzyme HsdR N-terminal domain-containing protein [Rhodospirillales bacterium]|nr:type I restriction enzyme HsdR N-terminal domain-containing protein [Rhodospirillales bacterium]